MAVFPGGRNHLMWYLTSSRLIGVAHGLARIIPWLISSDVTAPVVDLGYAQYQGHFDAQVNITSFLGIRYAAPPVGNSRFQAPGLPIPVSGVQPATQNPSKCYQVLRTRNFPSASVKLQEHGKRRGTTLVASEDCLFLNVFVPGTISTELVTSGGLPVLVWIHGGGYHYGSASDFDGANLVTDSLNTVVVVSIQYRLGAFGFLSGKEIKAHGALNAGLLDQHFALKWIQEHIGSFGGDKNHVTIWGESAGGGSVLQHIVANGGDTQPPLFNAAIASSAFLPSQYAYDHQVPQSLFNQIVAMTGCTSSIDLFKCLQSVDAETLQTANYAIITSAFCPAHLFVPVVDGTFIVERPSVTLSKGHGNGEALLAFVNQNEGNYSVDVVQAWTTSDYVSALFTDLTTFQVQEVASIYEGYGTPATQAMLMYGDSMLVCPSYYLLRTFSGRSWKGLFAILPAFHGDDLDYYFNSSNDPPPYYSKQFIAAFSQSFMSLAKYYDVNTKIDPTNITPYWNKYNIGSTEMLFNRTDEYAPVVLPIQTDPSLLRRCAFWSSVTTQTAQ